MPMPLPPPPLDAHALGIERMVAEALEAIGDAAMPASLLHGIAGRLGSHKAMLFRPVPGSASASGSPAGHVWGLPADLTGRYAAAIHGRDVWTEALLREPGPTRARGGVLSQQLVPTAHLRQTAFFADDLRPLAIDAMVHANVEESADFGTQVLALYNEMGRGEFSEEQFRWLRAATPWVQMLLRAHQRIERERQHTRLLQQGVDGLPIGLVQAGPGGRIEHLNEQARAWLGIGIGIGNAMPLPAAGAVGRDGLSWRAVPEAESGRRPPALTKLVAACASAEQPRSCRVAAADGTMLVAVARPVPAAAEAPGFVHVVLVQEHGGASAGGAAVCAALYGMTAAEAALLPLLLQGMTPSEIADALGVKLPTVRTHLGHLFAKTGTRRQAELVQRVMRVTAIVSG